MNYDVIIVGGGSAGCVAAGRLAGEFGARVLLLEAGGGDRNPLLRIPAGLAKLMVPGSRYYTEYASAPQRQLGGRIVPILQSKVLGGGSALNAMTYTRGTKLDYDRWNAALDGAGWAWSDLLPYFMRQEANQRLGAPFHGTEGPLKVSDPHHPIAEISRAFLLALQARGVPFSADFNAGMTAGAGVLQSTTYRGERWSAARAFLEPLHGRDNLTVSLGSRATQIVFEGRKAVGVEYGPTGGGQLKTAYAAEIVLAAGCFASAQLLMLSGIGPAKDLRHHDVPVRVDLPGVGQGLQDHNDVRVPFEVNGNIGYSGQDRGLAMLRNGLQYALFRSGPATSTGTEVTAFINPVEPAGEPSIQYYCLGKLSRALEREASCGVTLVANLVAPRSRGTMTLRSADPRELPVIDPNWLSEEADLKHLVGGVEFMFDVVGTAPLRGRIKRPLKLRPGASRAEIESYAREVTGTNWHPVGSCRMGRTDDPATVVDPQLRVQGVEGVRVFDGSIMPTIIGANTNAPIMVIADRGVDFMMGAEPPRGSLVSTASPQQEEGLH